MSGLETRQRTFRQILVPRPFAFDGITAPDDVLVCVGMPITVDSVVAQLSAPASLRDAIGRAWNSPKALGAVVVQLYQPGGAVVFDFRIPVWFRERKRYVPPLNAGDKYDNELPLLVRVNQAIAVDSSTVLPATATVSLTVNLLPDFYEG